MRLPFILRVPQEDEVRHKAAMEAREAQHRAEWEVAIAEKQRLSVMRADEASFRKSIMDRRAAEFEALRVRTPFQCPPF